MFKRVLFLSGMFVLLLTGVGFTADTETAIKTFNQQLFNTVQTVVGLVMFGIMLWQFIEGYMQKNLNSKWMTIIGCAIFLAVVAVAPTIYKTLTNVEATTGGSNAGDFIGGSSSSSTKKDP